MTKNIIYIGLTLAFGYVGLCNASGCPQCATEATQHINRGLLADQVKTAAQQLDRLKDQLANMESQYKSLTGTRNLGELLRHNELKQYLPSDYQRIYDSLKNGGNTAFNGEIASIESAIKRDSSRNTIIDQERKVRAANKAIAQHTYEGAGKRLQQIESLIRKINTTSDPKGIAELQARIAAEQAVIENEAVKIKLMSMLQNAEQQVIQAKKEERQRKLLDNSRTATPRLEIKYD